MVSKLTKAMGALSQHDEDDHKSTSQPQERRKSARLNKKTEHPSEFDDEIAAINKEPHDSGTESDEEEIASINSNSRYSDPLHSLRNYDDYLTNPPRVTASPAWKRDLDETESWDSFGRESGIMTGDNDSDTDGMATPTPVRRRLRDDDSSSPGKRGHEEPNPMADHPIAWRLRSFNNDRAVKVAARRCPVHILFSNPPVPMGHRFAETVEEEEEEEEPEGTWMAPKRGRMDSHRPSLDFEKMVQTRIEEEEEDTPISPSGPVTRSQINQ